MRITKLVATPLLLFILTFLTSPTFSQSGPNNTESDNHPITQPSREHRADKVYVKGRKVEISSPLPITVIGKDELQQIYNSSLPEITQTINYTNQAVMTHVETRVILRGGDNARYITINNSSFGYNPDASLVHSQTLTSGGLKGIPLQAIEQIKLIGSPSNVQYGKDAIAGVVRFTSGAGLEGRIKDGEYVPYYSVPVMDFTGIENKNEEKWKSTVASIFQRGEYEMKLIDDTYGANGSRTMENTMNGDYIRSLIKYYDKNNNLRQEENTEWYPENYSSTETKYYSCEGKIDFSSFGYVDQFGFEHDLMRTKYSNGKPSTGAFLPDSSCNEGFQQHYNPKSEEFGSPEDIFKGKIKDNLNPAGYFDLNLPGKYVDLPCDSLQSYVPADTTDDYNHNIITVGINFRFEDFGGKRELFLGGNVTYTYFPKDWIGATVDLGFNFGKIGTTKYSIGSYFAGPTFVPFKNAGINDKFTFSLHTLGGYTGVTTKNPGGSNTNGNFSLKLGLRGDFNITDKFGIYLGADDYMVLGKGSTSNNYTLSLGARLGFK